MNEVKIIVTAENRTAQEFERVRRAIKGIDDDVEKSSKSLPEKMGKGVGESAGKAAKEGFKLSIDALKSAWSSAPPEVKAAGYALGGVLGAAAFSLVAASLSGAALAGAASIGVVQGLKLAANDPEVQAAGAALGERITGHLQAEAMTSGFVREAVTSLDELGKTWDNNSQHVAAAMRAAAGYVAPLREGVQEFIDQVLPKAALMVQRAGPVINVLSEGIGEIGDAIGFAFDEISRNGNESAAGIRVVLDLTVGAIRAVGILIRGGTELFGTFTKIGSAVSGFLEDYLEFANTITFGLMTPIVNVVKGANDDFERLRDIASGTAPAMNGVAVEMSGTADSADAMARANKRAADATAKLNEEFSQLFGTMMSVEEANIAVKLGFIESRQAILENGKTLNANSEAGLRNRQIINDQIRDLERQRQAAIDAGEGSVEATNAANTAYLAGLDTLRKMLKQLGLLTPEMEAYIKKWEELTRSRTTTLTVKVRVVEEGGKTPARGLYAQAAGGLTPTGIPGAASGMMLGGGGLTAVGEYGPELVRLPPGAQVYNNGTSRNIMAGFAGGAGGGGVMRLVVEPAPAFGDAFTDAVIEQLRFRIRNDAGGDIGSYFAYAGV